MTKRTPEKFAKNVLWQLAGIRAAIDQLRDRYCLEIATATGTSPKRVAKQMAKAHKKLQKKLFMDLVASSQLND
jgi:hypothetical protein